MKDDPQPAAASLFRHPPSAIRHIHTSDDQINETSWNNHYFLDGLAADVLLDGRIGKDQDFDRLGIGLARHAHVAALLAVHLHHQLDFVLDERGLVGLGPRRHKNVFAKFE